MQRTVNAGHTADLEASKAAFDNLFERYAAGLPDANRLHRTARRSVAIAALDKACRAFDEEGASQEPIDEYVAIAVSAFPDARRLRQWRAFEKRQKAGVNDAARTRKVKIALRRRDLEDRLRWRKWRWSGL